MLAAFDWANLGIAGAFVAGAVVGTVATIRVTKIVAQHWDRSSAYPPDPPAPRRPGE